MRVSTRIAIGVFAVAMLAIVPNATVNAESYAGPRWSDNGCGMQPMDISELGKNFIRTYEGLTLTPHFDSKGYAIGYGMHTWQGKPVKSHWPRRVTLEQVEIEFDRQLDGFSTLVRGSVCTPLTQPMLDGLMSLAWNVGRVNTAIIRKIDAGRPVRVADFLTTARIRGRHAVILVERRHREFLMFGGNYDDALLRPIKLVTLQRMTRRRDVLVGN